MKKDAQFEDGKAPPTSVAQKWLTIVDQTFNAQNQVENVCIAVHCISGLGRAPLLVALALTKRAKLKPVEAVRLVREVRKQALNQVQINYLMNASAESSCLVS